MIGRHGFKMEVEHLQVNRQTNLHHTDVAYGLSALLKPFYIP